jgi:hypothetical protein
MLPQLARAMAGQSESGRGTDLPGFLISVNPKLDRSANELSGPVLQRCRAAGGWFNLCYSLFKFRNQRTLHV